MICDSCNRYRHALKRCAAKFHSHVDACVLPMCNICSLLWAMLGNAVEIHLEHARCCERSHESAPGDASDGGGLAEDLAQRWCFVLRRRRLGGPADYLPDVTEMFAELLRCGWEHDELKSMIASPSRDRSEYLWQFKARLSKRASSGDELARKAIENIRAKSA